MRLDWQAVCKFRYDTILAGVQEFGSIWFKSAIKLEKREEQRAGCKPGRAKSKSIPADTWLSAEDWNKHLQVLKAATFRKLGIGPARETATGVWASQVLNVLGPDGFAEFPAIRTPGKILWCNFDLARQLGFKAPRTNQLTRKFEARLLSALSLRATGAGADSQNEEVVTMYADKYGGEGVRPALGAGRAGFVPYGNLYIKGLGFTPLFKHDDPDDFVHSHGEVHMDDCLSEAVFGEVNENLFTRGSARVLAIIDQGRHVTDPSGRRVSVCLVVRAGAQLRPGHLLGRHLRGGRARLEKFLSMTQATGQLVMRRNPLTKRNAPDVRATMLRIIDAHALTAAESFRWRLIHGALTASNMEMNGAMLDLATQSTQPRTAPISSLDYGDSVFGREHTERALQLIPVYRALLRHTSSAERDLLNVRPLNIAAEMDKAYPRHLQVKLLCAIGLKTKVAQQIQTEQPGLAARFTELILQMVALKNSGGTYAWKSTAESVSVLDVFHLLQRFPEFYFADPGADHAPRIRKYLKPVFKGNRFQVARKRHAVARLIREFADLYGEVMKAVAVYVPTYYADMQSLQGSIRARAVFENEPIDALYSKRLSEELGRTIRAYERNGDAELIRSALDQRITASVRSVDGLLAQGSWARLPGGGVELEKRILDGICYSVRAWNDAAQTRRLHVTIPVDRKGSHYLSDVPNFPFITKPQIETLRYRFTTDGWKSSAKVKASLKRDNVGDFIIDFEDVESFPIVGRLDGTLGFAGSNRSESDQRRRFGGYVFAIPDQEELISLAS